MNKFLVIILICLFAPAYGQTDLDSLKSVWRDNNQHDSNRLKAYYYTANKYLHSQPDSAFYFAQLQYDLAKSIEDKKMMANALNMQGISFYLRSELDSALSYYNRSLLIRKDITDKKGIASSYNNIGLIFSDKGDNKNAISCFTKSLKLKEEIGNINALPNSLINIGLLYYEQGSYSKALEYFERALSISKENNNQQGISSSLNNMGMIYSENGENDTALVFYSKSLKIKEEIGDKDGISNSLINIGTLYEEKGEYDKAKEYYSQSLKISEEVGNKEQMAKCLNNIGQIHYQKSEIDEAIKYSIKSLSIANEIGAASEIEYAARSLYHSYKRMDNPRKAMEMYELYISMRDSIQSKENHKKLIQQEYKYKYEKKLAADSVKAAEAKKVMDAQLKGQQAELRREKTQRYALYGGLGLLILFGAFMYNRFRITRKQKILIAFQKSEVEKQKSLVDEKNEEILSSIAYAKRIQDAILPPMKLIEKHLLDCFVLYKPKDIVAGDFYWLENEGDEVYFAAGDCTGHGVPGAMVSVVCSNALKRAVKEMKIKEPAKILDKVRELVVETFEKSEEEVKDGMDISFCRLNKKTKKLVYSGAHNPLYRITPIQGKVDEKTIKNEDLMLIEYKGDKQPIGIYSNEKPFIQHEIQLLKGDLIYLSSDGYPDQFGGPRGRKFMYKPFKNLFLSVNNLPMSDQLQEINKTFEEWRGKLVQIDDVCIIGVRIG